jgi:hypothetical protein
MAFSIAARLKRRGGKAMRLVKFASLLLCALCFIVRGDAQSSDIAEKPVWTLEFIEVRPNNMGLALGYLDDHWMRVREEAKRQGAVLSYHRISEALLVNRGSQTGDPNSIVLLTEYKNLAAFSGSEKLFASIVEHQTPGVIPIEREGLYDPVDTRVFLDQPAETNGAQFKLIAKQ